MGKLRIGPPPDDNPGDFEFAIHHMLPFRHGGVDVDDFHFAPPPPIDEVAASQPVNLGFSPLRHAALPDPDEFRPVAPPLVNGAPARQARRPPKAAPGREPQPPAQPTTIPMISVAEATPTAIHAPPPRSMPPIQPAIPAPTGPPVGRVRPASAAAALPAARPAPREASEDDEPSLFESFEPLYALAIYLAAALGTLLAIDNLEARYTILWSVLVLLGGALTLVDSRRTRRGVEALNLAWGIGYGALIGGLLLAFVSQGLLATSRLLFPESRFSLPSLFQTLVLLGPLGETIFFRGVLQERRGIIASIVGAGLGTLLFYWPSGSGAIGTVVAIALFLTALAGLYSYIRQRYGLAAAYACQVTLNLMLFFIPRLLFSARP